MEDLGAPTATSSLTASFRLSKVNQKIKPETKNTVYLETLVMSNLPIVGENAKLKFANSLSYWETMS